MISTTAKVKTKRKTNNNNNKIIIFHNIHRLAAVALKCDKRTKSGADRMSRKRETKPQRDDSFAIFRSSKIRFWTNRWLMIECGQRPTYTNRREKPQPTNPCVRESMKRCERPHNISTQNLVSTRRTTTYQWLDLLHLVSINYDYLFNDDGHIIFSTMYIFSLSLSFPRSIRFYFCESFHPGLL